ncbi:RNA-binding protein [Halobacteriovorax sp. HFRX-2_2]|uniref:RNA recognition motif domain-containing protein n=1 Tax=unclassified Halobacteriovorax TaxID=2639665 RepID=UPI00371ABF6B
MKTVYIGNLNYKITSEQLKGIFSRYGRVQDVNLLTIPGTQKSKGIAFIKMQNDQMAQKAVDGLDGSMLDGRTVKVSIAKDNFEEQKKRKQETKAKVEKEEAQEIIIEKKKARRRRGLNELFDHLGKK